MPTDGVGTARCDRPLNPEVGRVFMRGAQLIGISCCVCGSNNYGTAKDCDVCVNSSIVEVKWQ